MAQKALCAQVRNIMAAPGAISGLPYPEFLADTADIINRDACASPGQPPQELWPMLRDAIVELATNIALDELLLNRFFADIADVIDSAAAGLGVKAIIEYIDVWIGNALSSLFDAYLTCIESIRSIPALESIDEIKGCTRASDMVRTALQWLRDTVRDRL